MVHLVIGIKKAHAALNDARATVTTTATIAVIALLVAGITLAITAYQLMGR